MLAIHRSKIHRLERLGGQELTTVRMTQPRNTSYVGSRRVTWFPVHTLYKMEVMS